jgi:hypothetical protein
MPRSTTVPEADTAYPVVTVNFTGRYERQPVDATLLRHFVAVAEELHYAHAAKRLDIPRSSVVLSVRALEEELGYELFDRGAPTTVLTEKGVLFFADAKRQLDKSAASARANVAAPGGKAKASKGKGRAPAVKGERKPGKRRQSR